MSPSPPPRIRLGRLQTPLEPLTRTSRELGVDVWIKRDDLTGSELCGNKVRKLEYLLADAVAQSATTVITCGGEQSNHARATALAAARLGLAARLVLRTADPANPPRLQANLLLDRLVGAEVRWISPTGWRDRAAILEEEADAVRRSGGVPYVIPEGGSNALGSWGYVECAREISEALSAQPSVPTTVVVACGSGGTCAGLLVGAAAYGWRERGISVAGVNVCDDRDYFVGVIGRIVDEMCSRWRLPNVRPADIDIVDGYVGRGYAKSRPEEAATIRTFCRREGVVLDPVYTGKAFHGLVGELAKSPRRFGERVVFVHTGGIFGLFADPNSLSE